ncbi:CatB-related O-acetyltransferase [[Clostridium] aminophilum]|uniref:Virginiamycin A acetyltransferase n=1 Tax=[Clostridium] aminophilum TaxID=1526 RepID=A0A1I6IV62_9FIRM|nr:CatB-related O-acetyltransferase [[Clostridium] aminophilum]SFR70634.1 virginiamycin A acetyltransferase [[Clostridium] aminophilum]
MINNVSIMPNEINKYTEMVLSGFVGLEGFPLLTIDSDSYIVGVEIQSGLNFDPKAGRHQICIGKGCALAEGITFMVDLNHDYRSIAMGEWSFLKDVRHDLKVHRKGTIIIQNDVWIGHGATIMSGVTLHNGCVVAANSVVTKDVPPYAIVGGNPARVIRYRFENEVIDGLQKIAWWDWPIDQKLDRKKDFDLEPKDFVNKYLLPKEIRRYENNSGRKVVLLIPDVYSKFPLWPQILEKFLSKDRNELELLIYLSENETSDDVEELIYEELKKYDSNCYVTLQFGKDISEQELFEYADYYITTRHKDCVHHTSLCDLYGVEILYGTDEIL